MPVLEAHVDSSSHRNGKSLQQMSVKTLVLTEVLPLGSHQNATKRYA